MSRKRSRGQGKRPGPLGYGDLTTSLVFVFPLFLAYEVGVMFSSTLNGVDFVTRFVFAAVGYDRTRYLIVHLVLAAGFLGLLLFLRRRRSIQLGVWPPMVLESAIYALSLGSIIVLVMDKLLGFDLALGGPVLALGPIGEIVVVSLGAGVHEELVFRLGLMGGGMALLMWAGVPRGASLLLALAMSSVLFSAAHHVGPLGDPWALDVFTYRLLAGVVLGFIFYYRSLAHAVYAHFLYDVYVMLLRA